MSAWRILIIAIGMMLFCAPLGNRVLLAAVFNVDNATDFQNALTTAATNDQDDTINVAAGECDISTTLIYFTPDGDGGHTLTIQGAGRDQTILDGGDNGQVMSIGTDSDLNGGDNGGNILIRDLTIRRANSSGNGSGSWIKTVEADITIDNCTFSNNKITSSGFGAGVFIRSGSGTVTLSNSLFDANLNSSASLSGGGAYLSSDSGNIYISNNTFSRNSASAGSGGAFSASTSTDLAGHIAVSGNVVSGNTVNGGGAVVISSSTGDITVTNNIISGTTGGSGLSVGTNGVDSMVRIINNTITNNTTPNYGGGLAITLWDDTASVDIYNNIIYGNTANFGGLDGDDVYINPDLNGNDTGASVRLYNNDLSGNAVFAEASDSNPGNGILESEDLYITDVDNYSYGSNIQTDPLFIAPASGNFHLQPTSPCIDAGDNNAPAVPATDIDGNTRPVD
ncbi:MAG: hypothetical protein JRI89_14000, partial [Deltaproteobacteria bacterium]|nr:hypothetical protein [Deltaproteobacteria bacterium]